MEAGLASWLFWASLAFALAVAFVVTVPVNRWMISRGRGHAVVHAYHHCTRGAPYGGGVLEHQSPFCASDPGGYTARKGPPGADSGKRRGVAGRWPLGLGHRSTQMPGTSTIWNRWGEATVESGYRAKVAWKAGSAKALRNASTDSHTAVLRKTVASPHLFRLGFPQGGIRGPRSEPFPV